MNRNTKAKGNPFHHFGKAINSSEERQKAGRRPYSAPTMKKHPILAQRDAFIKQKGWQ